MLGFGEGNIPTHYAMRRLYRSVRAYVTTPEWVHHPLNIQIDTTNYCNLWMNGGKGCIHCNVKPTGGWKIPRGWMDTEMIEYIIDYWGNRGVHSVAPYINGEPMLDERLPWICDISQRNGMHVLVDTNGTLFDKRKNLVHPNLFQVRFTLSAITPETYNIVHGADLFREAEATIDWFLKNKLSNQYPMLYFITNRYNMQELTIYIKKWMGKTHLTLFPLHEVEGIQLKSTEHRPDAKGYWNELTKKITGRYPRQPYRPIDMLPNGQRYTRHFERDLACQGSHSFSVSWNGLLLHCTDIPYSFNYGHVYESDMLQVWHYRNFKKIGHPACSVCNVRHPDHDKIMRRYCT